MLDFLKKFQRERIVKQMKQRERDKKIENFNQISSVGIIFRVGGEYEWNVLYHFVKGLENSQKKVSMIGFQESGTELNYIITHSQTIICHEKEDINFWGVPKEEVIEDFVDKHYDLLIDATEQPDFFGQYMTLKADADLKVSYIDTSDEEAEKATDIYDMMIHGDGPIDMKDFLINIINYLSIIQKQ